MAPTEARRDTSRHNRVGMNMRKVCVCLLVGFMLGVKICRVDAQQSNAPYNVMLPDRRGHCFEILELERLKIDPRNGSVTFYPQDTKLYVDYTAVTGGIASARTKQQLAWLCEIAACARTFLCHR
jgi:hypothetical protein